MSRFKEYNASQIVPQMTLLEKFNKLIEYLKKYGVNNLLYLIDEPEEIDTNKGSVFYQTVGNFSVTPHEGDNGITKYKNNIVFFEITNVDLLGNEVECEVTNNIAIAGGGGGGKFVENFIAIDATNLPTEATDFFYFDSDWYRNNFDCDKFIDNEINNCYIYNLNSIIYINNKFCNVIFDKSLLSGAISFLTTEQSSGYREQNYFAIEPLYTNLGLQITKAGNTIFISRTDYEL